MGEDTADQTCDFCGKFDPSFNEDKLDLHYYTECPLLIKCKECGQVGPQPHPQAGIRPGGTSSARC